MQDRQLYEQILGIVRPWSVERVELNLEAGEVGVTLKHAANATWSCPECGRECPLYDHEPDRTWRHLDTCQYHTFYESLSEEQLESIEAVAMDMWEPYIQATAEHLPQGAEKIVFDRFHIAKNLSDAVDRIRRTEHRKLRLQGNERLTGTKYLWLKNPSNISDKVCHDFGPLRNSKLRTARGWAIKETPACFWDYRYAGPARKFFDRWYSWVIRSRLEPIKKVARTLKARLPKRLNYFRHRITHATSESFELEDPMDQIHSPRLPQPQRLPPAYLRHSSTS